MNRLILFFYLGGVLACKAPFQAPQQPHPFTEDGRATDWPNRMYHNPESGFTYAITQDQNHVYVFLEVEDPRTQLKVLLTGLTIWLEPGGGKGRSMGVRFPIGAVEPPEADLAYLNLSRPDLLALQQRALGRMNEYELLGTRAAGSSSWHLLRQEGPLQVRVGFDREARLLYEAEIPFDLFPGIGRGRPFGIGLETGHFDRPTQLGGMTSLPGQRETLQTQQRIRALSQLTTPSELWLKNVVVAPRAR